MAEEPKATPAELCSVKLDPSPLPPVPPDTPEATQSPAAEETANESDEGDAENESPTSSSDSMSEEEVRFFIGLVLQWFRVMRDPKKPVENCADIERYIRSKREGRGARHHLWSLQMQCKFAKTFDPSMLRKKWDNLMRSYKKLFEKGMGPTSTEAKTKFKYWEDINEFFETEKAPGQPGRANPDPVPSTVEEPEEQAPEMPLDEVIYLLSLAKKACQNNDPSTIRVTPEWCLSMEKKFGKTYRLASLEAAWKKLLSTQENPASTRTRKRTYSGTVKFFENVERIVRASVASGGDSTNEEDGDESDEEVSDREPDDEATVVARELIAAFQHESRKDRKLMRKMLTVFSRATGVDVDVETSDDE